MVPPLTNLANPYDTYFAPIPVCQFSVTAKKIDKMEDHNPESYKLAMVTG